MHAVNPVPGLDGPGFGPIEAVERYRDRYGGDSVDPVEGRLRDDVTVNDMERTTFREFNVRGQPVKNIRIVIDLPPAAGVQVLTLRVE